MVAPRSPTNLPTNAISVSMSTAGVSVFSSVVVIRSPQWTHPGWMLGAGTVRGVPCKPVAAGARALQPSGWRVVGMRAREPDEQGHVERDGVRIGYETFGFAERDA